VGQGTNNVTSSLIFLLLQASRSSRLIPNELEVIKTELRHLDRQWEKIDYYKEHISDHEEAIKSAGMDVSDIETAHLKDHHEKMQRKLKKLEAYLESKITSHSEL
jgi:hypothetical protein